MEIIVVVEVVLGVGLIYIGIRLLKFAYDMWKIDRLVKR